MRLAIQIALEIVLSWMICASIAVAVLAAIRMRGNPEVTNSLR